MCVCLVAGVCATFPVQGTTPAHCSASSWATPGAGSARLALRGDRQPDRAEVAGGYRFRNSIQCVTWSWCGFARCTSPVRHSGYLRAEQEHGVDGGIVPMVWQTWPANCCPAPLRHCKYTHLGAKLTQQTCTRLGFHLFCGRSIQTCQTAVDLQSYSGGEKRSEKCLGEAAGGLWLLWGPQSCRNPAWGLPGHHHVVWHSWAPTPPSSFSQQVPLHAGPSSGPLPCTGTLTGVGEMGSCPSSHGSGNPHRVVPCLLQVLHSCATSKCI